jgi:competence protein ComEC
MVEKTQKPRVSMYPLLWLAAFFALGIVVGEFLLFDIRVGTATVIVLGAAGAIFRRRSYATVFILCSFATLGALTVVQSSTVSADRVKRIYDDGRIASGDPVEIEGFVRGGPEPGFSGYTIELETLNLVTHGRPQPVSGSVRLFVSTESIESQEELASLNLGHGSHVVVACRLEREERFQNPGVMSRKLALDQRGIDAVANVKSPLLIEKLSDEGSAFLSPVFEVRRKLTADFQNLFSVPTTGILIASLLGDKSLLDKQTADLFREGGTFHILVISGLHITFIGGLSVLAVGFFTRKRIWKFVVPVAFLWGYTIAVGGEVPVVRASLMFTVLLLSQVIYRKASLLNTLGLCALLLLAWRPMDLLDPSFQLTFVSVAAIVACAFPLIEKLREIGRWMPDSTQPFPPNIPRWLKRFCEMLYWNEEAWRIDQGRQIWTARIFKSPYLKWIGNGGTRSWAAYAFEGVIVSLIVQLWMLPLVVWYFHRVSIVSVILNLWSGIFLALESFAAVIAVLLSQVSSWLAFPFVRITELFNILLLWLPRQFTEQDWASFRVPVYAGEMKVIYFIYFIPLIVSAVLLHRWDVFSLRRVRPMVWTVAGIGFASSAILAGMIIFHPYSAPTVNGRLTIDFLDVGQGDSALVTFSNGKTMLVDGGGRINYGEDEGDSEPDIPRVGEAVVSEFLWEKGYSHIDYLVASHADADHIQGLSDVALNFDVAAAYFGKPATSSEFEAFLAVVRSRNIPAESLFAGELLEIDGVRIEVLNPRRDTLDQKSPDNNGSLVLRMSFGERSFLFTGDIEAEAENRLLAEPSRLIADVIKVPHHGSRTSSTPDLVGSVKPSYAVISVGSRSRFGHPHTEVVERWQSSGATVMRTGERGTITISTDGTDLKVGTYK